MICLDAYSVLLMETLCWMVRIIIILIRMMAMTMTTMTINTTIKKNWEEKYKFI